jgi:SAM-dependent methyltransferase
MGETDKAYSRRIESGWFDRFCTGEGLDIGAGEFPLHCAAYHWEKAQGDAVYMRGLAAGSFDYVYASHVLEHLSNPYLAIVNWARLVRPGGRLIISVPHRDLYERKADLPSIWNQEHCTFWLPDTNEPPCTLGLRPLVRGALPEWEVVWFEVEQTGWYYLPPEQHAPGEFSIEIVVRRPC